MGRPTKGMEAIGLRVCVLPAEPPPVRHRRHRDGVPHSRQVELEVRISSWHKKLRIAHVELNAECPVDLITFLRDCRTDCRPIEDLVIIDKTIASTVFSKTPPTAPRQPAWAAPITPASKSTSNIGAQSAVTMPSAETGPRRYHGIGLRRVIPWLSTTTARAE